MKLLAMTVFCVDLYQNQTELLELVGGNALNFATQAVKSGLPDVAVLGAVGNDR